LRTAIIHYWFIRRRGGERVVESLLKLYPEADIYTLFYDKEKYDGDLKGRKVYSSILNNPFFRKNHHYFFPLFPVGIKLLKLKKKYDLIISSESGPSKGIKTQKQTPHICYVHTPMRYCWGYTHEYTANKPFFLKMILKGLFYLLRLWDKTTIDNVDLFIANSENVKNRIKKFYGKEAKVIFPPVRSELFKKPLVSANKKKKHFLCFGALVPYKRIDLLVDLFNGREENLVVIGDGPMRNQLEKKAGKNIQFFGRISWDEVEEKINESRALIFPGEEDFGIIPLEVMALGIPVIAYAKGGALETVINDKKNHKNSTGVFFSEQSIESLRASLEYFKSIENEFDPEYIRNHASSFKELNFLNSFSKTVKQFLNEK